MRTSLLTALLSLPAVAGVHASATTPLPVCATTDPVVVLGQPVLPSETVCVPPQLPATPLSAAAGASAPAGAARW